jgi:uncharacterized integral membrane protein
MLGLIIILAVLLAFIGFNLDNKCDLSLGITSFRGVPIYLTVFASFMLGMLCSLPFIIFRSLKKRVKSGKKPKGKNPDAAAPFPLPGAAASPELPPEA